MQLSLIAKFHYIISSDLAELECEDLPKVILLSSKFNAKPELKKIFLELVVERYETEIEMLNSQDQSYQFRDPIAFLESIPPPQQEEISLLIDVQEKYDGTFMDYTRDAVN